MAAAFEKPGCGMAKLFRLLRSPPPGRLAYIMTSEGPTADPHRVDAEARAVWGAVYAGQGAESGKFCLLYTSPSPRD
eukprot:15026904-Alexandrium_andersonii.AAC.1